MPQRSRWLVLFFVMLFILFLMLSLFGLSGCSYYPDKASTTVRGAVELATTTEAQTGTDSVRAVTPQGVEAHYDNKISVVDTQSNQPVGSWANYTLHTCPSGVYCSGQVRVEGGCSGTGTYTMDVRHGSGFTQVLSCAYNADCAATVGYLGTGNASTASIRVNAGSCTGAGLVTFYYRHIEIKP